MKKITKRTLVWLLGGVLCAMLALTVVGDGLVGRVWIPEPEKIPEAAQTLMHSLQRGDWETLGIPQPQTEGETERLLWEAYQKSLKWQLSPGYGIQDGCVTQSLTVTCLDIPQVTQAMTPLLADSQTREEAARQALESGMPTMTRQITLKLKRSDGRWQVQHDKTVLALLSAFI